jgi:hypothetical protein
MENPRGFDMSQLLEELGLSVRYIFLKEIPDGFVEYCAASKKWKEWLSKRDCRTIFFFGGGSLACIVYG